MRLLNLRRTQCTDNVCAVIGKNCEELRTIIVADCPVTDVGLINLCSNKSEHNKCKKIVHLDIMGTRVSTKGVIVAINNLPCLKRLAYNNICDAIHKLIEKSNTDKEHNLLSKSVLSELTMSALESSHYTPYECLLSAITYCPYVVKVELINVVNDEALLLLTKLSHLNRITVANSNEELVTFNRGIVPLLTIIGHQLIELNLSNVNNTDFAVIGALCPILETLVVFTIDIYFSCYPLYTKPDLCTPVAMSNSYHNLSMLTIVDDALSIASINSCLSKQHLLLLLANALHLTHLTLTNVQCFNDDCVQMLISQNSLLALSHLKLVRCHEINISSIIEFLKSTNALNHLELLECHEITLAHRDFILQFIKKCNLQLHLNWI